MREGHLEGGRATYQASGYFEGVQNECQCSGRENATTLIAGEENCRWTKGLVRHRLPLHHDDGHADQNLRAWGRGERVDSGIVDESGPTRGRQVTGGSNRAACQEGWREGEQTIGRGKTRMEEDRRSASQ